MNSGIYDDKQWRVYSDLEKRNKEGGNEEFKTLG